MKRSDAYKVLFRLVNEEQRRVRVKRKFAYAAALRGKYDKTIQRLEDVRNFLAMDPAILAAGTQEQLTPKLLNDIAWYEGPSK